MSERPKLRQDTPRWMVTYADLMALLLCLFVLLLSFSEVDSESFRKNAGPINEAFGILKKTPETPSPQQVTALIPNIRPIQQERVRDVDRILDLLEETLVVEIAEKIINLDVTDNYVVIRFPGRVAFPSGTARIAGDFTPTLEKIGRVLAQTEGEILVAGHTDSTPISTSQFRSNWDLSTARAVSVVHQVLADGIIDPSRLTAQGFADTRSLAPNDTTENRSLNRRVEISVEIPTF
ncbi:MAG: OmpA family protein [Rhodospirillales bacterium]|jgi:chemotaxis protein MotB|nr:OmpA family protein [Rhodospirillales bacterium]